MRELSASGVRAYRNDDADLGTGVLTRMAEITKGCAIRRRSALQNRRSITKVIVLPYAVLPHSARSAVSGSTRVARHAGTRLDASASPTRMAAALAKLTAS